jgi:acyl-ACP thioesterase
VIRRNVLRVERLPRFMETIELRTWCAGLAASTAERRTTIEGDAGAAIEATAIWVHVDVATRRPARFPPHFLAAYEESAAGNRPSTRLHHPSEPTAGAERSAWSFSAADMDVAGHVNNAVYWRVLEDLLGGPPAEPATLEAEYRGGITAGQATVARAGGLVWVIDGEGAVAASLTVGQEPA